MTTTLKSQQVIVQSPMSFVGSTKRVVHWTGGVGTWQFWLLGMTLLTLWWSVILVEYVCLGLLIIPWRLWRHHSRNEKKHDLEHQEMMELLTQQHQQQK